MDYKEIEALQLLDKVRSLLASAVGQGGEAGYGPGVTECLEDSLHSLDWAIATARGEN